MADPSLCHPPGENPMWQESMAFVFCDDAGTLAGTAAFGTFVHRGTGLTWLGLFAGGPEPAVFQRSRNALALRDADRTSGRLGVGSVRWERGASRRGVLVAKDESAALRLEFDDLYPPTPWHDVGDVALETLAAGHVECSSRVTGEMTLGARRLRFDGWGHRDHSWGPRQTDIVRNHRWVAGTCGPELGFSAEALHLADGTVAVMGFVAREGEITRARAVENLVTLDHDGLTPRRFESRIVLDTGEQLVVESEDILVCLYNHRDPLVAIDALARVRCGRLTGFADLNLIANPQAGTEPPSALIGGTLEDGLVQGRHPALVR